MSIRNIINDTLSSWKKLIANEINLNGLTIKNVNNELNVNGSSLSPPDGLVFRLLSSSKVELDDGDEANLPLTPMGSKSSNQLVSYEKDEDAGIDYLIFEQGNHFIKLNLNVTSATMGDDSNTVETFSTQSVVGLPLSDYSLDLNLLKEDDGVFSSIRNYVRFNYSVPNTDTFTPQTRTGVEYNIVVVNNDVEPLKLKFEVKASSSDNSHLISKLNDSGNVSFMEIVSYSL